ncbi:MAG: hypothetical protein ACI4SG_06225 [Oligosphaeraceae bacterium]
MFRKSLSLLAPLVALLCLGGAALSLPAQNLFPGDCGYELGLGYFRRPWFNGSMNLQLRQAEDAPQGHSYAVSISTPGQSIGLSGDRMTLKKNVPYVLSMWVRASRPKEIRMATVHEGWKDTQFHPFTATPRWERVVLPFTVNFDAIYWVLLEYTNDGTEDLEFCLDAVQLEEGTEPTPFSFQGKTLTVSHLKGGSTGVYFVGEPVEMSLGALADGEGEKDLRCRVVVTDYRGEAVFSQEVASVWENGYFKQDLTLPGEIPGLYVLRCQWLDGDGASVGNSECSYAVVRPPVEEHDPEVEPYMGVNSAIFAGLRRVGTRWVELDLWWRSLMPTPDTVEYDDILSRIRSAKAQGYSVKFSLVHLPATPDWAHRPEEVEEAKSWGLTPSMGFFSTEEALEKLSVAFEELIRRAGTDIDLLEIGGEDELISGSEPYYRRKYPSDVFQGVVHGPVCRDVARITTVYLQAARRARPDIPIACGRPSGSASYQDFLFSRLVLEKVEGEFQFFPMDCYSWRMRYINEANMPNIGSPNLEYPIVFERANHMTHTYLQGQKPFVSEYGFAIDNRLPADHPLQQEECRRMLSAALTAKLLGSPYFFWFNTFGCIEDKVFDYGMWHVDQPMLLIPAMSQLCRVVEDVRQCQGRLGETTGNLKMGVFGQKNRAVLAIWTEFRDNPVGLTLPQDTARLDFLGNPLPRLTGDEAVATKLPQYFVLEGEDAYDRLRDAMEKAEDRNVNLSVRVDLAEGNSCAVVLQSVERESQAAAQCVVKFPDGTEKTLKKPSGTPFPWRGRVAIPAGAEEMELVLQDDRGVSASRHLSFSVRPLQKGANTVAEFGSRRAEIMPADPWIHWDGAKDLGGTIGIEVTPTQLIITADVQDDLHFNRKDGHSIWDGDCLQIALVPRVELQTENQGGGYGARDLEIAIALANGTLQSAIYAGTQVISSLTPGRDFQVERDEEAKVTHYRLTLSRQMLGLNRSGQAFRFCAVVMDDDEGSGESYFYQISPGITGAKNVGLMPIFRLP